VLYQNGNGALHLVSDLGDSKDMVELLIGYGAPVNMKNSKVKNTPLDFANFAGREDIARVLVAAGAVAS